MAEREGPAPIRKRAAPPKEGPRLKRASREDLLEPQEDPAGPLESPPNLPEGLSEPQKASLEQPKDGVASQEDSPRTALIEHPVYYVSTVLRDAREKYPVQQKLLYALLVASRKLRHYFQGHPIKVVSAYPLERILRNSNATGRVAEWAVELQPFELEFLTTTATKGGALAEFNAE